MVERGARKTSHPGNRREKMTPAADPHDQTSAVPFSLLLRRLLLLSLAALSLAAVTWFVASKTSSLLIGIVGAGLAFLTAIALRSSLLPRRGRTSLR
jgi:uncharacterized membrane protein